MLAVFTFLNDTAATQIYTLSLHDALPIFGSRIPGPGSRCFVRTGTLFRGPERSEEHTSELQSRGHLVCRLLLEKKKGKSFTHAGRRPSAVATPNTSKTFRPPWHWTHIPAC